MRIPVKQLFNALSSRLNQAGQQLDQYVTTGDKVLQAKANRLTPNVRGILGSAAVAAPAVALGLSIPPVLNARDEVLPAWARATRSLDPVRRVRNALIRAPENTVKINSKLDLLRYTAGMHNKLLRESVKQIAKPVVTGAQANAFYLPPMGGSDKGAIIYSKSVAPSVLKHEIGHARDYEGSTPIGRTYRFSMLSRLLNAPISAAIGQSRGPVGSAERKAWRLSGVPKDDPLRQKALDTYDAAGGVLVNPMRTAAISALILKYLK